MRCNIATRRRLWIGVVSMCLATSVSGCADSTSAPAPASVSAPATTSAPDPSPSAPTTPPTTNAPSPTGSPTTRSTPPPSDESGTVAAVDLKLIAFRPDVLTIDAGRTIRWTQQDPGQHTVISGTVMQQAGGVSAQPDGRFASAELSTGETFEVVLSEPGTYAYFCSIHPATMQATVVVT